METYKDLFLEWQDWAIAGSDYDVLSALDRKIPGGWEKMKAVCDKETAELFAAAEAPADYYEEEEDEEEPSSADPVFATAREREMWAWRSPKFPHPYMMQYLDGVATEIIEDYVIATMPEKVAIGLATFANWLPTAMDVAPTINITYRLDHWDVDDLLGKWIKAHPDANLQNIPDLDGNAQWCRKD